MFAEDEVSFVKKCHKENLINKRRFVVTTDRNKINIEEEKWKNSSMSCIGV